MIGAEPPGVPVEGRPGRQLSLLIAVLSLPVSAGVVVGARWPDADTDYYAVTSQLIATLFVALAIEVLAPGRVERTRSDTLMALVLVLVSWAGLCACLRALLAGPAIMLAGLSAAGMTAALMTVALAMSERLQKTPGRSAVLLIFLLAPLVLLLIP